MIRSVDDRLSRWCPPLGGRAAENWSSASSIHGAEVPFLNESCVSRKIVKIMVTEYDEFQFTRSALRH